MPTVLLLLILVGCASTGMQDEIIRPDPSTAELPATTGALAKFAAEVTARAGADESGFRLLDSSYDGLLWRLALIDSAVSSIDIMTYLWYPDNSGTLLLERAVLAAERGVRVRLVVDDLLTIGQDQLFADIQAHPNIELRVFNPWKKRGLMSRAGEMIAEMERLNTRMHDKLQIADGRAAIIGGRNIGDHYFGLGHSANFRDLDVLGIGPVALQANDMFDQLWNSEMMVSAENLKTKADPEKAREAWENIRKNTREAPELEAFPREVKDWSAEFKALLDELHFGKSMIVYDRIDGTTVQQDVFAGMFNFLGRAQEELLITNAYIIPGQTAIDFLQVLADRGVKIRMLTNSLASHDTPAVNAHYQHWRDDLVNAGVDLYELRKDPAIAKGIVDVPPVESEFTSLHTKAVVIDSELVFIGSMNMDPRSANINTEMGAVIQSPGLAGELRSIMLRDMRSDNAWRVTLDEDGELLWTNSDETVDKQPSRGFMNRVMNTILRIVPVEQN